jgi:hypothetical protein
MSTIRRSFVTLAASFVASSMLACSVPAPSEPQGATEEREVTAPSSSSSAPAPSASGAPAADAPTSASSASGCAGDGCAGGATTGVLPAGARAIEVYGAEATKNASIDCSSAQGGAGVIVATELSTGQVAIIAGAAATGPTTLVGGDGTARSGAGSVAVGVGGAWDPTTSTLTLGGALAGYYTVDVGTAMPADAQAADAAFDAAFGSAARYGASLDRVRTIPWPGGAKAVAYYNTIQTTVTGPDGAKYPATVAIGIVNDWGKVKAVQFSALGAWQSYVK